MPLSNSSSSLSAGEYPSSSYVRITLNGQTLLDENLTSPIGGGFYTWNQGKYPIQIESISFPVNATTFGPTNYLNVSVGPVSRVGLLYGSISALTYFGEVSDPFINTAAPLVLLLAGIISIVAIIAVTAVLFRRIVSNNRGLQDSSFDE
jgi:hypothetical protein